MSGNGQMFAKAYGPFVFKRGQCFLCSAKAVTQVCGEPVCAEHRQRIEAIKNDAEEKEQAA